MCNQKPPRLYVGTMNDAAFVIDQPPRPSHDDGPSYHANGPNVIATCGSDFALAERLVAAWNTAIETCARR
jgi:hypothetical protein